MSNAYLCLHVIACHDVAHSACTITQEHLVSVHVQEPTAVNCSATAMGWCSMLRNAPNMCSPKGLKTADLS